MPISYAINELGSDQIPNGSEFVATHEAFATWEAVTSADIEFDFEGTIAERSVGLDGTNLITFADDSDLLGACRE